MTHRYMVSVTDDIANYLTIFSKIKHKSISKVIQDLILEAVDAREDYYLSKIAEEAERRAEDQPTVSAEEVWRRCGLE